MIDDSIRNNIALGSLEDEIDDNKVIECLNLQIFMTNSKIVEMDLIQDWDIGDLHYQVVKFKG